ncbi:hypothetical protein LA303_01905 [Candidatus Sulfidibacterium hydrothermale]|uniref:hypothetical protein n=1 Tax=Candidatus Sulfidibacterium hydrothermale TaxID=2875962 RepID=UPI001F0A5C33|nr:hypothetical protein [Candidatus Sulfidibacterium hydrothermale]UBM62747.1 hypothetical protein LA303_01905 [Candidatus Sulfidibacterium hydrothermale]
MESVIEMNQTFSLEELARKGLKERDVKELSAKIFVKDDKVYFFDEIENKHYRLYSVIHKRSFFL